MYLAKATGLTFTIYNGRMEAAVQIYLIVKAHNNYFTVYLCCIKMATGLIFVIIRIIFKYGRGIIIFYGFMIGGFQYNETKVPPTL